MTGLQKLKNEIIEEKLYFYYSTQTPKKQGFEAYFRRKMRMEKPNYYAIIPATVRYDKDLKPMERLLYGEITALCGASGYCWGTNRYFSELYGVSTRVVSKWISNLVKKKYINIMIIYKDDTKEVQERRIYIVPIGTVVDTPHEQMFHTPGTNVPDPPRTNVPDPHEQKFQENNTRVNITSNNNRSSSSGDDAAPKEPDIFDELWRLYPRKEGKKDAYKAYKRAIKSGTTNEQIRQGIENYKAFLKAKNETTYIKQGSTFFNGEHWNDEFDLTQRGDPYDIRNQYWDESDPTVH